MMDDQQYFRVLQRFEQLEAEVDSLRQNCRSLAKGLYGMVPIFATLTGQYVGAKLAGKYKDLYKNLPKEQLSELCMILGKGDEEAARHRDAVVKLAEELDKVLKTIESFKQYEDEEPKL